MDQKQKINQCIQDCHKAVSDLQTISGKAKDKVFKSTIDESVHHLEMCVKECEYASRQAP